MARRSEHSLEQIRELAINAVETLIQTEGLAGLTARKVAMEMGYTVGSIYMVFADMQDLILHVNARTLELIYHQMAGVDRSDPQETLLQMADIYQRFAQQQSARWRLLFEVNARNGQPLPDWYLTGLQRPFLLVETVLHQLAPEKPAEQINLAARTVWSAVQGICVLTFNGHSNQLHDECAESLRLLINHFLGSWCPAPQLADAKPLKK